MTQQGSSQTRMRITPAGSHFSSVSYTHLADGKISDQAKEQVNALLNQQFRPEFLNRLDEIVFYKPLTRDEIGHIVDLQIADLQRRLTDKQLRVELTPAAKTFIVDSGYDPIYGARPLKRFIQSKVETVSYTHLVPSPYLRFYCISITQIYLF